MNFLVDIIPPKMRRYVYGIAALLGLVVAAWTAADGNWRVAVTSLVTSALSSLAHANTTPEDPDQ